MTFLLKSSDFLVLASVLVASNLQSYVVGAPLVPCYFIFGDSLVDNGNNNVLATRARVNYPPYGVDYTGGPTGRFTNGKTTVDILAELLGFTETIRPFANASDQEILRGVNYASGSAGILDESGSNLGNHVGLNLQLKRHQLIISRLKNSLKRKTASHLSKCLYTIGMGSNDYLNNYFLRPQSASNRQFTPDRFAGFLVEQYSKQIRSLHQAGARKIALFGVGAIGCTPYAISLFGKNGSCAQDVNAAVQLFNGKLKSLVDQLNKELTDSKFIYIEAIALGTSAAVDPTKLGFKVLNVGCCQVNSDGLCNPNSTPCPNRNEYTFWDGFHPTEAVNKLLAESSFKAVDPSQAHPFDISKLVQ